MSFIGNEHSQNPATTGSVTSHLHQNMRLAFDADGTAVYRPISPTYNGNTNNNSNSNNNNSSHVFDVSSIQVPHQVVADVGGGNGSGFSIGNSEPLKRKRGRPRKYSMLGDGILTGYNQPQQPNQNQNQNQSQSQSQNQSQLHNQSQAQNQSQPPNQNQAHNQSQPHNHSQVVYTTTGFQSPTPTPPPPTAGTGAARPLSPVTETRTGTGTESGTVKKRGRPPGSLNKKPSAGRGIGFIPHVITVKAGENVLSKIMTLTQHGSRAICVLSANGTISNATICQAATSGGTVTYEGLFEILSLSGSFLLSESGGQRSRTGGLSISLAGPDGRVFGGGVAGLLTAANSVQVIVGSFNAEEKKPSKMNQSDGLAAAARVPAAESPSSHGTFSESSGGNATASNQSTGPCNNNNAHGMMNISWE